WDLLRLVPREEGEPSTPFSRRIELDDRIARFLLGLEDLGAQLDEVSTVGAWAEEVPQVEQLEDARKRLTRLVGDVSQELSYAPSHLVVHVYGRYGTGKRSLIASVCKYHGLRLLRVDAAKLAGLSSSAFEETLRLLARELRLQPTAICLENIDSLVEEDVPSAQGLSAIVQALQTPSCVVFLTGVRPWTPEGVFRDGVFQRVALELPSSKEAQQIWIQELADEVIESEIGGVKQAAAQLAARFTLSPGQIHDAVAAARTETLWQTGRPRLTL